MPRGQRGCAGALDFPELCHGTESALDAKVVWKHLHCLFKEVYRIFCCKEMLRRLKGRVKMLKALSRLSFRLCFGGDASTVVERLMVGSPKGRARVMYIFFLFFVSQDRKMYILLNQVADAC